MLHTNQDFQIKEPRIGSLLNFGIPFLKSNLLETIYQAFVKSVKQVTTPFSKETGFEDLILLLILQIIECLKLSDFCNSLHGEPKFALLEYLVLRTSPTSQSFPTPGCHHLGTAFARYQCSLNPQSRVDFPIEQRATKKWVVTTSLRGEPGPIECDLQRKQ